MASHDDTTGAPRPGGVKAPFGASHAGVADASRPAAFAIAASPRTRRLLLLAYGLVVCFLALSHWSSQIPDQTMLMGTRQQGMTAALQTLKAHHLPLAAVAAPQQEKIDAQQGKSVYYAEPQGDDVGMYLYVPLLAWATGHDDVLLMMKWLFLLAFAPLFLFYPLIFGELFKSILAGLAAPLLLVGEFGFLLNTDVYWATAWCMLAALPLLCLVYRTWGRRSLWALAGVMVIASMGSSIRQQIGFGILLGGLLVVLFRVPEWRRRLLYGVVLVVAYLSVQPLGFDAVRLYRDQAADRPVVSTQVPTIWHSIYIGLGYGDNPYGIYYSDSVAYAAALKERPGTVYLSHQYSEVLRHLVVRIVRTNPGFVANVYSSKAGQIARDAISRFWWTFVLVPLMCLLGPGRRERRRMLLLLVPALAVTFLPPLLVLPIQAYELAWFGVWGVIWMLGLCWLAACAGRFLTRFMTEPFDPRRELEAARAHLPSSLRPVLRSPWTVALGAVALLVLALTRGPIASHLDSAQAYAFYARQSSPLTPPSYLRSDRPLRSWNLTGGSTAGWLPASGTHVVKAPGGLTVTTNGSTYGYQLIGPRLQLPAGRYVISVQGKVSRGGLILGLLDLDSNSWLAQTTFWYAQWKAPSDSRMALAFTLAQPTSLRPILSNSAVGSGHSTWLVKRVSLLHQ